MRLFSCLGQSGRSGALSAKPKSYTQELGAGHFHWDGWRVPSQIRRKKLLIIVECAALGVSSRRKCYCTAAKRVEASLYERMARYWCRRADLSFYTQPVYLERYHRQGKGPAYVAPATWVDAEDILEASQARLLWDAKVLEPVHFLFAGRLDAEKGVKILLEAVEKLAAAGVRGAVHVIGDGRLRDEVIAAERPRALRSQVFRTFARRTTISWFSPAVPRARSTELE